MSRKAVLATTSILLDSESVHPGVTIHRAFEALRAAAAWKPDLVVFPEELDYVALGAEDCAKCGESIPGSLVVERFAGAAREAETNLVIGLREREDDHVYNAGVVVSRQGELVGKYRKTHLAPGEDAEVEAGDDYPVFELDFGKLGVMICMDLHYPEPWRILALRGADVIAHPTMWLDYTGDLCESVVNARAIDNQVYVVTSHYVNMPYLAGKSMGHSRVVDPYGRTRASTSHRPGVAVAEVDLDEVYEYWGTGDLKRRYPTLKDCFLGDRRPETYGAITCQDNLNQWKLANPKLHSQG